MSRGEVALELLFVWFVVAFIVRVALHFKRTGRAGIRGLPADAGLPEIVAGALFMSAIAAAPISVFAGYVGLSPRFESLLVPWTALTGAALMFAGIIGTAIAQRGMGRSWRIGVDPTERTDLVTTGVFAFARNPIYTAMLVGLVGLVLLVPSAATLIAFGLMLLGVELQVRLVEEPYLRRQHGEAYANYTRRVGRFLPGIGVTRRV